MFQKLLYIALSFELANHNTVRPECDVTHSEAVIRRDQVAENGRKCGKTGKELFCQPVKSGIDEIVD